MNKIYNREAINKIASEDHLDKMIVLATPGVWVSIIGAFIIILSLFIWGFFGTLPTKVDANGIFTNSDGTYEIFSKNDGFVLKNAAKEGEHIGEGDLIATLGTEDEIFELEQMDTRIQYVEAMTFDSEYDIVTSDTSEMSQIKLQAKDNDKDLESKRAELELKKEKLAGAAYEVKKKEDLMLKYKEQYYATLSITDEQPQIRYTEANNEYDTQFNLYENAKNTYITAKESYYSVRDEFDHKYENYDPTAHTDEENGAYYSEMGDVESARSKAADYESLMKDAEERLNNANRNLESARSDYLSHLNEQAGMQASNTMASTEYTEVLTAYNTAKTQYKSLSDEVDELQLQVLLSEGDTEGDSQNNRQKFENVKSAKLLDLKAQRDSILNRADKGEIRSSVEGILHDCSLYPGQAVMKGNRVAVVLAGDIDDSEIISYIPLTDVKKVRKGMKVYVYPSTVKKEEYGHILGEITSIEPHVESREEMEKQLGSDSLVTDFSKKGSVVKVRCKLERDAGTRSGYKWSSKRGTSIPLESDTIVSMTVITESKSPIDLLIPYLRDKMNFEIDEDNNEE